MNEKREAKKSDKRIVGISVLIVLAMAAFVYFHVPGRAIRGVDELHTARLVQVRRSTTTQIWDEDAPFIDFEVSDANYELNANQIEMLQEFLLGSSFTRTSRGSVLLTPFPPSGVLNRYDIFVDFSDGVNPARWLLIHITGEGYFMLDQFHNRIKINNPYWEETMLQILAAG